MSAEDQHIIVEAERKIAQMLDEVCKLQELIKEVRQKESYKQDTCTKAKALDKMPQLRAESKPRIAQQPETKATGKKKEKKKKTQPSKEYKIPTEGRTQMPSTSNKEEKAQGATTTAPSATQTEESWARVVGRKEQKRERERENLQTTRRRKGKVSKLHLAALPWEERKKGRDCQNQKR